MKALAAIAGIVLLEIVAMLQGMNGFLFLTAIGIISGLGSYFIAEDIKSGLFDGLIDRFRRGPLE